jgi:hypothetical protein
MKQITGNLAKLMVNINKKMGDDTIVLGSDITESGKRFTSGSVSLDANQVMVRLL